MTALTAGVIRHDRRQPLFGGANRTLLRYELHRRFNRQTAAFTLLLPAVLYLALFHTAPQHATMPHGNFAAWMMIGLAVYGAAMAATSSAATISVERSTGWTRTIALTPLTPTGYILIKVLSSMAMAAAPVGIIGVLGALTGARADAEVWVTALAAAWLGSAIFAAFGIVIGLAVKPEIVLHLPGLAMTALAFLGNLFIPLSGTMLTVSRFTPMYGISTLARHALTDGYSFAGEHSSVTGAVFNLVAWFAVFSLLAIRWFAKSTVRQ